MAKAPLLVGEKESIRYRVAPDQRFEAAWKRSKQGSAAIKAQVSRQTQGSKTVGTLNENFGVEVRELRYPGKDGDVIDVPEGRWAYVFDVQGKKCVAEARRAAGKWEYRVENVTPDSQAQGQNFPLTNPGTIELRGSVTASSTDFWVFLAPFRLSKEGLKFLLDDLSSNGTHSNSPLVKARPTSTSNLVAWVPEPFHWCASAHYEWFWPLGDAFVNWVQDEKRQQELFIASTLKGWLDNGATQIENNLQSGQPKKHLKAYESAECKIRKKAEIAAAYLVQCVDSPEHFAVEASGMELGEQALSEVYQQWGLVLRGLSVMAPGRIYLDRLSQQKKRLPLRYLFTQNRPANDLNFANYRYAFIGLKEAMVELVGPYITQKLKGIAGEKAKLAAIEKTQEELLKYLNARLEKAGVKGLKGTYKTIYQNLAAGKSPTSGTKGPYRGRVFKSFTRLEAKIAAGAPADEASKITQSMDVKIKGGEKWFGRLVTPVGAIFEIINLSSALEAYRAANPQDKGDKAVSLVGASADLAAFASGVAASFAEKRAAGAAGTAAAQGVKIGLSGALTGIGGGFAVVAGICEMRDQISSTVDAGYGRNNMASAVGSGFAAVGAGITVVAGGMAAAWALSGGVLFASSAGGPIGVVVGIIGALIIAIGAFIATLFTRDPYEQFAEHSFLGDSSNLGRSVYYKWANAGIPTSSRKSEAGVLLCIIGAYVVEMKGSHHTYEITGSGPCNTMVFRPGYFPRNAKLQVRFEQNYGGKTYVGTATFSDVNDKLMYTSQTGIMHDDRHDSVKRDEQGRVQEIHFTTRPRFMWDGSKASIFPDSFPAARRLVSNKVKFKLELGVGNVHIPSGQWLEFDLKSDSKISSFDDSKYKS